ncbi:MAG TPA: branched-chain amino acid transaminase [Gemmatimonadaceae bacterium]|jgi:branched-chain amino acid aminotransferase|nr:branched-chain amino acid transaminase [Gemmatimonadaceae bacterium]
MTQPVNNHRIWRDGQFVNWDEATVHVMSHVIHYGSSIFEGIRCYETPSGPAIFRLPEHMRRFADSCKIYRMALEYSQDALVQACVDTVAENNLPHCYLRPVAIRGGQHMGVFPAKSPLEVFIIPWVWGAYLGTAGLSEGVDVCVSSWRRAAPNTFPAMAKAGGNYLNSQLSLMEARADNYSEGIMLDSFGFVSEGSGENLFLVRDGKLYTSTIGAGILHGITRDTVLTLGREMGIEVVEGVIPREMLYIADELFFTGTAVEITPIRSVDRIPIGSGKPGPISLAIQKEYMGIAKGTIPDRHGWLTHVPSEVVAGI